LTHASPAAWIGFIAMCRGMFMALLVSQGFSGGMLIPMLLSAVFMLLRRNAGAMAMTVTGLLALQVVLNPLVEKAALTSAINEAWLAIRLLGEALSLPEYPCAAKCRGSQIPLMAFRRAAPYDADRQVKMNSSHEPRASRPDVGSASNDP
jgi:hypothetical protein